MKKYLWFGIFLFGLSALVTVQHQKHADDAAAIDRYRKLLPIAPDDAPQTQSDQSNPKWYSPSGETAWMVFGWPNGITVWALLLTMVVIAEQTQRTAESAKAARDAIRLQEAGMRQWVDILNWKSNYIPAVPGGLAFINVTVELVNPTNFPLTIHKGFICIAARSTYYLADEFFMTPRTPYTINLGIDIGDQQEWQFLRNGLWFAIRGEMPHIGILGKLQSQPICGHITCVNGLSPTWHPEMPEPPQQQS